ncbi:MAG: hypothetical protein CM15mP116_08490 [Synechococcus sp.]|nr:MAG: hypothetical protein CM15mP116_08490 [Synechococcus sp.]
MVHQGAIRSVTTHQRQLWGSLMPESANARHRFQLKLRSVGLGGSAQTIGPGETGVTTETPQGQGHREAVTL